ncbi:MAG: hypothetical protein HQL20_02600 [Candidatus Omnitrophica bacterium]|nr:hypothetical protein [Candidatus Omnitrophota bacterium]
MTFIYPFTFVLAFCALFYELLIARAVSLWAVNNAIWYALAVGIFIGGMGLGAWLTGLAGNKEPAWRRLLKVESGLALAGGVSVLAVYCAALGGLFLSLTGNDLLGRGLFFGVAFLASLGVGIGAGMELPLLMLMAEEVPAGKPASTPGEKVARILLADYAGSLAAGLVFPLVILPAMSIMSAAVLVALINAVAALWLLWHSRARSGRKRVWLLVFLLTALYCISPRIEGYFTAKYYFSFQDALTPVEFFKPRIYPGRVERLRSPYQVIDLVTADDIGPEARALGAAYIKPEPGQNKDLEGAVLFLNNDFQFAVSFERIYHEAFAHIPVAAQERAPQKVLILGAGDGLLLREVLKYPSVKEVVLVDIDPLVLAIFRNVRALADLNHNSLIDPRVRVVKGDAYQYVRRSREQFDMVFCDFPNPDDFDLAKLYSREFYSFVRARLASGGLLIIDAPGLANERSRDERKVWDILSNSLSAAGYRSLTPFFSRLEDSDPAALAAVGSEVEVLRGYLFALTAGFIMASAEERDLTTFQPLKTNDLRVMTNERLRLGLAEAGQYDLIADLANVNSIVHPVFPLRRDAGRIRTGY